MSYHDEENAYPFEPSNGRDLKPAKGPQDAHWARSYKDIGTRLENWRLYRLSTEHHQCPDCGYYRPTEGPNGCFTVERMGRCWDCWMRVTRSDEHAAHMRYANRIGSTPAAQKAETVGLKKLGDK